MTNEVIGKLLRDLWEKHNYSIRGFAKKTGLSRESVRLYGSGARIPSHQTILLMLAALEEGESEEGLAILTCALNIKNKEITHYLGEERTQVNLEKKLDVLVDLFFEHSGRDRVPSIEHFIREKFREVEESL